MDAGFPSSRLTLSCSGCSHSRSAAASSAQLDCNPVAPACATCTVLQMSRTNCAPTKAEWSQIDALLEEALSNIIRLDRRARQRSQNRAELQKNRENLHRFINVSQSLTAPVRKLPPEILNEIFELLCRSEYSLTIEDPEVFGNDYTTQTLDLSQVCAWWRTIVLSRPALWASLDIDLGRVSTNEMSRLVLYHLQSSRSQPLHLAIWAWSQETETLSAQADGLFDKLLAESERWRRVRIITTDQVISSLSSRIPWMGFPILKNLEWCWDYDETEDYEDRFLDLLSLSDFPVLSVCTINSFSPAHLHSIRMPNLIELDLRLHFEHHPLAALFQLFPILRECRIGALMREGYPSRPLIDYPPHYHLRHLKLNVLWNLSSLERSFHSLSLPRLESFSLTCLDREWAEPLPSTGLLPMLDRSQLELERLSLGGLDEQNIIEILDHLPSLTNLTLQMLDEDLSSALLERLTLTSDMPNLCPQLRSLDIVERYDKRGAWLLRLARPRADSLCDMVESRCRSSELLSVSRLESLSLGTGSNSSPIPLTSLRPNHRFRERLQPLVDAGLSLQLLKENSS